MLNFVTMTFPFRVECMSQSHHKDHRKGGKSEHGMLEKERTASTTTVCGPSGSFQELEQWNVPCVLLQKYPCTSPAEDNARLMSAVGHAGVSFTLQGKSFITPFS